MPGAERERLIEEYHQALKKYTEGVSRLLHLEGEEFDRTHREVEALRQVSERCRAALEAVCGPAE